MKQIRPTNRSNRSDYSAEKRRIISIKENSNFGLIAASQRNISYGRLGKLGLSKIAEFELTDYQIVVFYSTAPFTLYITILNHKRPIKNNWRKSFPIWKSLDVISPETIAFQQHSDGRAELEFRYNKLNSFSIKRKFDSIILPIDQYLSPILKPIVEKRLDRVTQNPILQPLSANRWESLAVFNPAAIYLNNQVHLIYRAIGDTGLSTFGYASSQDGTTISDRLTYPVYYTANNLSPDGQTGFNQLSQYQSGVSWSGCEDPRLCQVDDTIYMTYTAFNGIEPPGVALTSIKVDDFLTKQWNWSKPSLISQPQIMQKNWVIFPEKIAGKYVVLHSLAPKIQLAYLDDLNFRKGEFISSHFRPDIKMNQWDSRIRGVGPPPIKTDKGWLVLYHAMDCRDPDRYKVGAMLLDLNDPQKILSRTSYPVLEPDARYENDGFKQGVVYTCGAVVIGKNLFVYYGGADTVICSAYIELNDLLSQFENSHNAPLKSAFIRIRKQKRLRYGHR